MKFTARLRFALFVPIFFLVLGGCQSSPESEKTQQESNDTQAAPANQEDSDLSVATIAGGCFWCMEPVFEDVEGVEDVVVGYTGGDKENPEYEEVARGQTSHLEAAQVHFDPDVVSYEEILDTFWQSIDPTDDGGQFADRGHQYTTAIFYHDEEQREIAEASRDDFDENGPYDEPIVTEIRPAMKFWVAEDYHQDYYKKNPRQYQRYYEGSGRARFFDKEWL